jgi:hypothetical protein
MARHSVQLVRVLGFDGKILRYMPVDRPGTERHVEVGDAYVGVAVGLAKLRLCKIIVEDGRLLLLELTS